MATYTAARRAYILNMCIEPAYRRHGMARRVLEAIVLWCRDQGLKAIDPTNEMRLYLR